MKKEKISILINDYSIKGIGTNKDNILSIKDNEVMTTFDLKNLILTRTSSDNRIKIDFLNKKVIYFIPTENKEFFQKLTIFSLTNNTKQVIISYQIEENKFLLEINHETIR